MSERYFPKRHFPKEIPYDEERRNFLKYLLLLLGGAVLGKRVVDWFEKQSRVATQPETWGVEPPPATPEIPKAIQAPRLEVECKTGVELLKNLGLGGKIVYIVYGRPQKYEGQRTWGSLEASRTAEESWQVLKQRQATIIQEIGRQDFTLNVLNPVYRSGDGFLEDVYIQKALELAPANQGLVALDFDSISDANETVQRLETILSKELLAHLAVGLDVEHFPGHKTDAASLNEFCRWFAQKHQEWSGNSSIPGLVLIYTLHGSEGTGRIDNPGEVQQYYLPEKTLVVPIFDGYGAKEVKFSKMADLIGLFPNTQEFPALLGVMEFKSKWGDKYDTGSTIREIFSTLEGTPVFFFASQ